MSRISARPMKPTFAGERLESEASGHPKGGLHGRRSKSSGREVLLLLEHEKWASYTHQSCSGCHYSLALLVLSLMAVHYLSRGKALPVLLIPPGLVLMLTFVGTILLTAPVSHERNRNDEINQRVS